MVRPTRSPAGDTAALRRRSLLGTASAVSAIGPQSKRASSASNAASAHTSDATDDVVIRLCATARAMDFDEADDVAEAREIAIQQLAPMRPVGAAAIRTKAALALNMLPSAPNGSCPPWLSPEEQLLRSMIEDVLALHDEGS